MKDEYTSNSYYITLYVSPLKVGRMYFSLILGSCRKKNDLHMTITEVSRRIMQNSPNLPLININRQTTAEFKADVRFTVRRNRIVIR